MVIPVKNKLFSILGAVSRFRYSLFRFFRRGSEAAAPKKRKELRHAAQSRLKWQS
jgi:hypothetical protein